MPRAVRPDRHVPGWRRLFRLGLRLGSWVAIVLDHLKPIRVPLLILTVAVVVALGVEQAAELFLIALWTDPGTSRYLWLLGSSALAGLSMWYVTRNAYRLSYPRWPALQDPRAASLRQWLPRLLGAAVPALVVVGYLVALHAVPHGICATSAECTRRDLRAFGLLLEAAVLFGFFIGRRRWMNRWYRHRGTSMALAPQPQLERRLRRLSLLPATPRRVMVGVLILNVLATGVIAWRPTLLDGTGPLAILLLAAAFMAMSGGLLCMLVDRRGWPLLTTLLLLTALLHGLHLNDNHRVRQYPTMSTHQRPASPPPDQRAHFDDYANRWLDERCERARPCPVVLVAAEGGGIRSAAWTALVLSRLTALVQAQHPSTDGEPRLSRQLFAASGVSGGSLGLASYVALLREPSSANAATLETRTQTLLGHDFLAPTLANMFFVDFTQRWLPGAWFDDRGRALTRAWEHAAQQQGVDAFEQPLASLYQAPDGHVDIRSPALFLNSTTVAEGRRFIQHPFQSLSSPQQQPWTAAFDGAAWLDPRLPLSEAVLNSARFIYISPAGTLETAGTQPLLPATLQLVDGGYYENSGATTLLEVLQHLRAIAAQRDQPLRVLVLQISNDPSLDDFISQHEPTKLLPLFSPGCPRSSPMVDAAPSGEAVAPLKALLDTRIARGDYARRQLLGALAIGRGDALWHLRLCPGDYPLPLGWTLSRSVFDEMHRQLAQNYPLSQMAQALDAWLGPPVAAARAR